MCDKFNKVDDQNVRNASNISVKNILQRLSAMASRVGFFNFESGSGIEEEKSVIGYLYPISESAHLQNFVTKMPYLNIFVTKTLYL